ncbi:IPT/TIG domain-containing protein [Dictyostelium discoideum AX4]|uniref:IPT/TIG domain-containing protein n=1 Tax=Dictyostelium discoideum TaxID=44689 RepID=Q55B03_DICDI|nr:IPT/TIG domain-containing protein [Dictyostelium discoideum AX4]EAL71663.1 IPT/TIG domain-containing protein [Dictyostelium discoideum AX4]|eukprot:XP_645543.1 IPT/TIG domain-containing protein [Dictyostelium discoideum AX4]
MFSKTKYKIILLFLISLSFFNHFTIISGLQLDTGFYLPNGIVEIHGFDLGNENKTIIELNDSNGQFYKISEFKGSINEMKMTFKLPPSLVNQKFTVTFKLINDTLVKNLSMTGSPSVLPPNDKKLRIGPVKDIIYNETSLVYTFDTTSEECYFTRFIMYNNDKPISNYSNNYFDCDTIINQTRYCVFKSEQPINRLWGSSSSRVCVRHFSIPWEDCNNFYIGSKLTPKPIFKFNKLPSTQGDEIIITGSYLRFLYEDYVSDPKPNIMNYIRVTAPPQPSLFSYAIIKGNFDDPLFDVSNLTVSFPAGSGSSKLITFNYLYYQNFSYAPPIITMVSYNQKYSDVFIDGYNFYLNAFKVQEIYFDGVKQNNFIINRDHTQIIVSNYRRVESGQMSINIKVNDVSMEKNFIYCFYPPSITSVNSITYYDGGIVTIKGSFLYSSMPTVKIGDLFCKNITSNQTEIQCILGPANQGGSNLPIIITFDGCDSVSNNNTFTYNVPSLNNAILLNGSIVLLNGTNIGRGSNDSIIEITGIGIDEKILIDKFEVSNDEKSLTFELPLLKFKLFNITINRNNILSNSIPISMSTLPSLKINSISNPTTENGKLEIGIYYITYPFNEQIIPNIFINSSRKSIQCSIPVSSKNKYITTCQMPSGTGINKDYILNYNSLVLNNQFSYAQPIINFLTISAKKDMITINGNNFGNSEKVIQVYYNDVNITSKIQLLNNNQFQIRNNDSFNNGPIEMVVDENNLLSGFNSTLPPIVKKVINNDCNGILLISGNRFITKLNENKVKVLVNNKETRKLANSTDDVLLVSSPQISYTPFNVSVYIGPNLVLSNVILNHSDPNVTKINQVKNDKDGFSIKLSGIGFTDSMDASIVLPNGSRRAIKCKLQCIANLESTNKINISNGTGFYLCTSKAIIDQDSIGLKMIFNSKLIEFDVDIDVYKGNDDNNNKNNSDSSKLSSSSSSSSLFILITIISILFYLIQ